MVLYPVLIGEMAKHKIAKKTIAQSIGVCDKALNNKLNGRTPFTWPEVKTIRHEFFPDIAPDLLFEQNASVSYCASTDPGQDNAS